MSVGLSSGIAGLGSVYGTQDLDEREQCLVDFSDGKIAQLSAKPVIAGSGGNYQRFCHRAIYIGTDFKANDFMQSVHRIQRFQPAVSLRSASDLHRSGAADHPNAFEEMGEP